MRRVSPGPPAHAFGTKRQHSYRRNQLPMRKAAEKGDPNKYKFPHPKTAEPLNFSFSGLKTAVLRAVQNELGLKLKEEENNRILHIQKMMITKRKMKRKTKKIIKKKMMKRTKSKTK